MNLVENNIANKTFFTKVLVAPKINKHHATTKAEVGLKLTVLFR